MSLNKMIEIKKMKTIASYIASTAMLLTLAGNSFAEVTLSIAFESSYYGISYVPGLYRGYRYNQVVVSRGGLFRLSLEPIEAIQLCLCIGKLKGQASFEQKALAYEVYDEGKLAVTEIPIELHFKFPIQIAKECYIYPAIGVLFCDSEFIEELHKRYGNEWIKKEIQGTIYGFPVIIGIEKRISKHWELFGEYYLLFVGSIKASWDVEDNHYEYENGLSSEEAFRRIRIGLSYLF